MQSKPFVPATSEKNMTPEQVALWRRWKGQKVAQKPQDLYKFTRYAQDQAKKIKMGTVTMGEPRNIYIDDRGIGRFTVGGNGTPEQEIYTYLDRDPNYKRYNPASTFR